jgi:DTW domain-containing protein YfiP
VRPEPCPRCNRDALCVCSSITPVETGHEILILQHPQEPDRELGTARIAHLALPRSTLRVGLSWPNLGAALGHQAQPRRWLVLYLGSTRPPAPPQTRPLWLVDRRGRVLEDALPELERRRRGQIRGGAAATNEFDGLVVLDGSWSQAKTLWWRNAWLLKLQRAVLAPESVSLYGVQRREPRREGLSTIESLALALSCLEANPGIEETLLRPFAKLLEKARYQR